MASSGIEIDADLKADYNNMKLGKLVPPVALLVCQLSDDKKKVIRKPELCLETCLHADLIEFCSHPDRKKDCFYAVFDYKTKLILIKWAPDTAPASKKMVYASTFAALKTALGIQKVVEASDLDDLAESELQKLLK